MIPHRRYAQKNDCSVLFRSVVFCFGNSLSGSIRAPLAFREMKNAYSVTAGSDASKYVLSPETYVNLPSE